MNDQKDLCMLTLDKYINLFSKTLQNLLRNDRYYIGYVIEFHELIGLFECLINNEILIKEKISDILNDATDEYRKHYHGNRYKIDDIVHRELNNLRSEIDRDLENYKWQIDNVLDCDCQGFDDHFLGKRDKFEFIIIGFKLLSKYDDKTEWINRLNNKIRLIDQDLRNILPILYKHYIQNCDYQYMFEFDKPTSLWWRQMHLDLLNNI